MSASRDTIGRRERPEVVWERTFKRRFSRAPNVWRPILAIRVRKANVRFSVFLLTDVSAEGRSSAWKADDVPSADTAVSRNTERQTFASQIRMADWSTPDS